jgi:alpha-galactosidase
MPYTKSISWFTVLQLNFSKNLGSQSHSMTERITPGPNLALTPPMGWNSFNSFGCEPSERLIKESVDAIVSTGLREAGYEYVNIDDGWMAAERDGRGDLVADPVKFPDGLACVVDYVHRSGLKAGIYLGAGSRTYGEKAGSLGFAERDARLVAGLGFDFLKYDYRELPGDPPGRDAKAEYEEMRDFLVGTGRPMVFSICEHGRSKPWEWGCRVGHLWRTTSDIKDGYDGDIKWGLGFAKIADLNERLYPFAGPGCWNDPDMLVVGLGGRIEWQGPGCTRAEYRSHFALWCLMAAPLIIGCDVRSMDEEARAILTNPRLIAVDQDPLGAQGRVVRRDRDYDVWMRKLAGGAVAVGLCSRSSAPVEIAVGWSELGFGGGELRARDLWTGEESGPLRNGLARVVEPHDCLVFEAQER